VGELQLRQFDEQVVGVGEGEGATLTHAPAWS